MKLSELAMSRDNNFNLIRLFAALAVLVSHSFALVSGNGEREPLRALLGMSLGEVAVDVFFITSGFLVTASLLGRKNALAFVWARILRIYPALWVMLLLTVLTLGPVFSSLPFGEFISHSETQRYVQKNATLVSGIYFNLPGVFENLPWKHVVNGSIWTLPVELKMYAILVLLWSLLLVTGRLREKIFSGLLVLLAIGALMAYMADHFYMQSGSSYYRLFYLFVSGSAYYVLRDRIELTGRVFWPLLLALCMSAVDQNSFFALYSISLPYLLLWLAYVPSGAVRGFNRLGDYSYGTYIYAFPVQQSLLAINGTMSVSFMIAAATALTLLLAVLSWHLVEKRALRLKDLRLPQSRGRLAKHSS